MSFLTMDIKVNQLSGTTNDARARDKIFQYRYPS
jgi:hypothetical protein